MVVEGRKETNYEFNIECVDGGRGWGDAGQKGYMIVAAFSLEEATDIVLSHIPGGWTQTFKGMTSTSPRFNTNIDAELEAEEI